jgi:hypothetical protein
MHRLIMSGPYYLRDAARIVAVGAVGLAFLPVPRLATDDR